MIRELNNHDWAEFCERLTKERAGARLDLETIEADASKKQIAKDAVFQSAAFEKTEGCSDTITLRARSEREIVHQIVEPIHIKLRPSAASDFNQVQIEAESGITIFTIHPPIHAQMLDKFRAP